MKSRIIVALLICFSVAPSIAQDMNRDKVSKLLDTFQRNLVEGLDLVPFDTIANPEIRKAKADGFILLCKANGLIAQIKASSAIEAKEKVAKKSLSDDELLVVTYDAYKSQIPELKKSYLAYIKSKSNLR